MAGWQPAASLPEQRRLLAALQLNAVALALRRLPEVDHPRLTTLDGAVAHLMADPAIAAKAGVA
jgi:hypothetical protein